MLQELHCGRYFCQTEDTACFDLAEPIPGPATEVFGALARELGIVIVTSLFERRAPGLYHNTAVVLETDGSIAGRYRKMHIPDDPGYYEKFYFTPGDLGFTPIPTSVGRLGVLICWDQWYPGGGPVDGHGRGRDADLSHRHRLRPRRYPGGAGPPARGMGDHPAQPCHRQRHPGAQCQPGRL